jgi:hypothetical protein
MLVEAGLAKAFERESACASGFYKAFVDLSSAALPHLDFLRG